MALRTIEEITLEMTNLVDSAVDRSLTDEEVTQYEAFEAELKNTQRTQAIRTRNAAYNSVTIPAGVPGRVPDSRKRSDYDVAFENYLRTGKPNDDLTLITNAQTEGSSSGGGYLVPQGMRDKIVEIRKAYGGFLNNVERITTSTGNNLEWPTIDDTSNSGDIVAEGAAPASGNDLVFGSAALGSYDYRSTGADAPAGLKVSVQLARDAAFDIESLVARKLAERIHRKQAVDAVTGNGVGRPQGILYPALTSDRDLATPDTIAYVDLVNLQDLLDEEYDQGAKWLMRKNTWTQIRTIVDGAQRPLIQGTDQGIGVDGNPKPRVLLEHEVIIDEAAPLNSSAGITFPIAYGNFTEAYVWRTVGSFYLFIDPYSSGRNGYIEYSGWEFADGVVQNRSAYKVMRNLT